MKKPSSPEAPDQEPEAAPSPPPAKPTPGKSGLPAFILLILSWVAFFFVLQTAVLPLSTEWQSCSARLPRLVQLLDSLALLHSQPTWSFGGSALLSLLCLIFGWRRPFWPGLLAFLVALLTAAAGGATLFLIAQSCGL